MPAQAIRFPVAGKTGRHTTVEEEDTFFNAFFFGRAFDGNICFWKFGVHKIDGDTGTSFLDTFLLLGTFFFLALIPPAACGLLFTHTWFIPGFACSGCRCAQERHQIPPLCLFCGQPPPDPAKRHSRYDISTTTRAPDRSTAAFSALDGTGMPLCLGSRGNFVYLVLNVVSFLCFTGGGERETLFYSPWQTGNRFWDYFFVCFTGKEKRCAGIYT